MGLSTRITVLTFVSVMAAVTLVSAISLAGVYRSIRAEEVARLDAFRKLIAGSVDARLGGAERAIRSLASELGTSTAQTSLGRARFHELLDAHAETFDALVSVDAAGRVVSSADLTPSAARAVVAAVATRTAGQLALAWDGADGAGRLWAGRTTGEGAGKVTVLARVRASYLGRTLDDATLTRGSLAALVVDPAGRLVFSGSGAPPVDMGSVAYSQEGTDAARGTATAVSPVLGGLSGSWEVITPDCGLGWRVLVMEPDTDAFARAGQALMPALLAMLFVAAAAVVAAILYSRRLVAPLRVFEKRARDVATGGYVRPLRIVRDDEMGRVAEAFNHMGVRLNSLQDMAHLLATASNLDDVLDSVLSAIGRILGTGEAAVFLCDPSGLALSLARGRGLAASDATLLIPLDEPSPLASAYLEQRPVSFAGDDTPGSAAVHRLFGTGPERAGVAVPLANGPDVIGVIVVLTPGHRVFTEAQIETLRAFSANAAVAVRTSRLFADERMSRTEAQILRSVAELTVRPNELGRALETAAALAAELLGYGGSAVALEGRRLLGLRAGPDARAEAQLLEAWHHVEVARPSDVQAGAPIVVDDLRRRPELLALAGAEWGSALFIPVLQGSIARGALVLHDGAHSRRPSERQLAIAETLGQQVSLAISNAHLLQQARVRAANLETVFRISQAVSSELQVGSVLNRVLDVVQKILSADAVALMSYNAQHRVIETSMTRGFASSEMAHFSVRPGEDIPGQVFAQGTPLCYGDLSNRPTRLAGAAFHSGFESIVAVPLMARGRPIGVLAVYATARAAFSGEDVELLLTFASQAALAIDTAALYGKEHRVASVLQASILPDRLPSVQGLETASFYLPCGPEAEIGGDYYDLFVTPTGDVALAIGDVCGKGVGAATKTSMVKYTLRGLIGAGVGPGAALAELNRQVASTGDPSHIVTMWVGILDRVSGILTYADGGHPPALLLRGDTRVIERLGTTGPLLGAVVQAEYGESRIEVRVGDSVLLYTDGVTEARRGAKLFGEGRVRRVLRRHPTAAGCVDALLDAVKTYAVDALKDDAAALVVRRLGDGRVQEGVSAGEEG